MHETIKARCHCGAVRLEIPELPATVTECNCSICRRYGARWAYYRASEVKMCTAADATRGYSWGDRTISFRHCRNCGCVTHYESIGDDGRRLAVNARMVDPQVIATVPVRTFDGADSWKYLD